MEKDKLESEDQESFLDQLVSGLLKILGFIWDLIKTAIIVAAIAFFIRFFLVEPFIVQGSSMEPNFHNLDYLLVEKVSEHFKDNYPRGSVVIFHPPGQPNQNFIKRIVGLPGEMIFIRNNQIIIQNQQYPKGVILGENYLPNNVKTEGTLKVQLGTDQYYLLGDNRPNSKDSRSFGPINKDQIIGRSWLAIYSKAGPHLTIIPEYSY
jgi:signal peptidase I